MTTAEDLISFMDSVSLPEIEGINVADRVDTKYVLSQEELDYLLTLAVPEYRVLVVNGIAMTPYRTLYFDTESHHCFAQHHNGKRNRHKVRIRQYASTGTCFLEVKSKNNRGRTAKKRFRLESFEEELSRRSTALIESITGIHGRLQPQLWTCFSRITLVDQALSERVTLDLGLHFQAGGDAAELPEVVIAEVKQQRDDRYSAIRQALRLRRIRPLRVSKYCIGSVLLKPELKYNQFKPKLSALQKIARR